MVTVAELKLCEGVVPAPILYCECCGAECSACHADYFTLPPSYEFVCEECDEPMKLVVKRTVYEEVQR